MKLTICATCKWHVLYDGQDRCQADIGTIGLITGTEYSIGKHCLETNDGQCKWHEAKTENQDEL